jgi:O-antigen/teichoic acid export membrane protein
LGGLAFGYGNQLLVTLVGLWLTAFLLLRLGQQDYGLWLVGTRILAYLMLLDLGVVALLPRETAFATGRAGSAEDARDLPQIVGRTARLVLWQMPLVALAALLVWFALPGEWEPLRHPLGIVLAIYVLTFPARIFQAVLNGLQDLAYLGAVHTVTWLLGTGATISLVFAGWGLYALAAGWGAGQILASLLWWRRTRRRYPAVIPTRLPTFRDPHLRERISQSLWVSVSQIAQVFVQGTDLLIIGKLLGPGAVVPYFSTAKVLTVLGHQPQMLAQTAQPALSELRTGASRERLAEVSLALTRAILLLSGAIVPVVLVVNEGFVTWWVGAEQYGGFELTVVLLLGMLLRHWNVTTVYSLFAFGHDRRLSLTALSDGAVTVTASILLVTKFGLIGAAAGSLIGVTLVSLPANLSGLAREMGVSVTHIVGGVWPWFWRFALIATLAAVVGRAWIPNTLPTLVLAALAATAAYGILMLPLALRDPLGTYVRPRLEALRQLVMREAATTEVDA